MKTCDHDRESYGNRDVGARNHCPECRSRICLRCKRAADESWMSGLCHGCYRISRQEQAKRDALDAERSRLRGLAEAWDLGATEQARCYGMEKDVGPNPYTVRLEALR